MLLIFQGLNVVKLFRTFRKEQTDAPEEERRQVEEERRRSDEMPEELQTLQARLAGSLQSEKTEDPAAPATVDPVSGALAGNDQK